MRAAVMAANLDPTMTNANAADKLNIREKALNAHKVRVLISVQQVLSRNLHIIELEEPELAQLVRILFKWNNKPPAIESLLESVPPSAKLLNVFKHGGLVLNEV